MTHLSFLIKKKSYKIWKALFISKYYALAAGLRVVPERRRPVLLMDGSSIIFFSSVRPLCIAEKVSHLDFKIGLHLENLVVSMKFTRSPRPRKLCARHQPRACKCKSVTLLVYSTIRDALMNLWSVYMTTGLDQWNLRFPICESYPDEG